VTVVVMLFAGSPALAKINIVCTLPDLCDIAKNVGGPHVETKSLSKGYQDPHFVDPRPSFTLKLAKADLLIHAGLQLEVGWLPRLITGSRNGDIVTGALGNLDCSTLVKVREVPSKKISRSQGDLHPGGNPHYWTDPRNGVRITYGIYKRLAKLDPSNEAVYKKRYRVYAKKLIKWMRKWRKQLKPYRGAWVIPYHQSWIYFLKFAGLRRLGTVERLPGVKPSAAHLANLYNRIKATKGKMVVVNESFYPKKTAKTVARKFNLPYVTLAQLIGGVPGASTYIKTIDANVNNVIKALKGS
jgi:zinc/manganese transport system substrate-binding protein